MKRKTGLNYLIVVILLIMFVTSNVNAQSSADSRIYWGAYIDGGYYGYSNPPWDMRAVSAFENHAGKNISILHFALPWYNSGGWPNGYYPFVATLFDTVRQHGSIPLLDWGSWDLSSTSQTQFSLSSIFNGSHDQYITSWAQSAKSWGHPFFLRFDWEMNGNWFPWSEKANGNTSGQFVSAWRHVHDIFTQAGADNVTWVWCPNTVYTGSIALSGLYPGDSYIDWTCIDGYNWGTNNQSHPDVWKSFSTVFKPTYDEMVSLAPGKPIMIGETASSEFGGSKASWITDTLQIQLPNYFPKVKAFVWFNWNTDNADWNIESSSTSQSAFAQNTASLYYAANEFSALATSPIVPLPGTVQTVTPARTLTPTRTPTLPVTSFTPPTRTPTRTPTQGAGCTRKSQGDADCNGLIDLVDFEIWRREFTGLVTTRNADYSGDGRVDLIDFEIWRRSFIL